MTAPRATPKTATSAEVSGDSRGDAGSGDGIRNGTGSAGSYFGGKGGCFRHLINQIPPHDWLIVPFAGHCAVTRNMQLPGRIWLNDCDQEVFRWWGRYLEVATRKHGAEYSDRFKQVTQQCGVSQLEHFAHFQPQGMFREIRPERTFVYIDPPYLHETRKSGHRYQHELSPADHMRLLRAACDLPCLVMISGYWSDLYAEWLSDWRHYSFQSHTRGGMAQEFVWCNYPEPTELQDYRWLGNNKRERYNLLRVRTNLLAKLEKLPQLERNALLAAVDSHFRDGRSR